MRNPVSKIVNLFASGDFSSRVVDKLHDWIASPRQWEEKDAALREVWDEISVDQPSYQTKIRFCVFCRHQGIDSGYRIRPCVVAAAAVALFAVVIGTVWLTTPSAEAQWMTVAAENGHNLEYTLPDSTKVWLGPGSTLNFPSDLGRGDRHVQLTGEAFFKVKSDESHPFEILVEQMKVVVTGTQFNVNAHMDNGEVTVSLCEGKVSVELLPAQGANSGKAERYSLSPNQHLVFNTGSRQVSIEEKQLNASDWTSGGLVFENASFAGIVRSLERHFDIKARYDSAAMPQGCYSIKFVNGESLEDIMLVLQDFMSDFTYDIEGGNIVITSNPSAR